MNNQPHNDSRLRNDSLFNPIIFPPTFLPRFSIEYGNETGYHIFIPVTRTLTVIDAAVLTPRRPPAI